MSRKTVCLNMIVKDEAHVIRRALDALAPLIDHWVIVDTGSTDATRETVREALAGIPGELFERPWKNFGHNRSEAIALARGRADYLMFFDADDLLQTPPGFRWPALEKDAYTGSFVNGDRTYHRIMLVADRLPWRYEGVIHAYATPDCRYSEGHIPELVVESRRDGARSKMDPGVKYLRNAQILTEALAEQPGNTRYAFYLAMSYQDAGQPQAALAAYERRAAMGGWDEEVWFSRLQFARLLAETGQPFDAVVAAFLAAHETRPTRAEALGMLARHCRMHGKRWALARTFAAVAKDIPRPADRLFLDRSWYDWRCLDEFATASYWTGHYDEAVAANRELLARPALPEDRRQRIADNLEHCLRRRPAPPIAAARIAHSIWIVTPPGYAHAPVFDEVALALQQGFAELGEVVPIVRDPREARGRTLVLGANRLSWAPVAELPADCVLFNLEQVAPSTRLFDDRYLELLRRHEVWDYSETNLAALRELGVGRLRHCGIGYAAVLTRIPAALEQDVDVLFYGSISGRRVPILEAIEAAGLRVKRLFGCYGAERDAWISRAKLVLNLHAHPQQIFAAVRVSYLLANRKCVVSEAGAGRDALERELAPGLRFAATADLAAACRELVDDAQARARLEREGFERFSRLRQADFLRAAIGG